MSSLEKATQKLIHSAKAFESNRIELIQKQNKIAWRIAIACLVLMALCIISIALMLPLKTVEPYLVKVDNNTGQAEIVYSLTEGKVSKNEAMDRYWLKNYVMFREAYDWYTVQDNYNVTIALSAHNEKNGLQTFYQGAHAPYKVFKDIYRVDVKVNAISFVGDLAQVRFEKQVRDLRDPSKAPTRHKMIATISYSYVNDKMTPTERLINPLGFKVHSYTTDAEQ